MWDRETKKWLVFLSSFFFLSPSVSSSPVNPIHSYPLPVPNPPGSFQPTPVPGRDRYRYRHRHRPTKTTIDIQKQRPRRLRDVGPIHRRRRDFGPNSRAIIKRSPRSRIASRTAEMGTGSQASGEELVGRVWDRDLLSDWLRFPSSLSGFFKV